MSEDSGTAPLPPAPREGIIAGLRALSQSSSAMLFAVLGLLFFLSMLPLYPVHDLPNRSLWANFTMDSGEVFRFKQGFDFFAVHNAGRMVREGATPYGFAPPQLKDQLLEAPPFRYPPVAAYWYGLPMSFLPPNGAYALWVGITVMGTLLAWLYCCGWRPELIPILSLLWLLWFPAIAEWHMGQCSQLIGLCLLWTWVLFRRGSAMFALPWGVAISLKVFPALALPMFLHTPRLRKAALAAVAIIGATTLLLPMLWAEETIIRETETGMLLSDRFISWLRPPYGGSMGVQELVNAAWWQGLYGSMIAHPDWIPPEKLADPVRWSTGIVLGLYGLLLAAAWLRVRFRPNMEVFALSMLLWFFAFRDCWEHHYLFIQGLLALLLLERVLTTRQALLCWVFAGTPSLWFPWLKLFIARGQHDPLVEGVALLYFIQRPVAVLLLAVLLFRRVFRREAAP